MLPLFANLMPFPTMSRVTAPKASPGNATQPGENPPPAIPSLAARAHAALRHQQRFFLTDSSVFLLRAFERLFGPEPTSSLLLTISIYSSMRRRADFPYFKELRDALPPSFWNADPRAHYLQMFRAWNETLAVALLYDRLASPPWATRFRFTGQVPDQLPDFGRRPAIIAFLHVGAFGLLRYCLRARGIPTISLVRGLPKILSTPAAKKVRERGDANFGLSGLPHALNKRAGLHDSIELLQPGRILTMALDGGRSSDRALPYDVGEHTIHLKDGAVRIARRTNAILLPATVQRTGPCSFEFRFGQPVPDELVFADSTHGAMTCLARALWDEAKRDPDTLSWSTLEALDPAKIKPRMPSP